MQLQTRKHFQALISIDGEDEATFNQCRPFLNDSRFSVIVQPERLGWVQNTNWLLARASTRYLSILPHDDLIHPYYLEELFKHLQRAPQCALAYCDTECFSEDRSFRRFYFVQPSLKGPQFDRMRRYLTHHFICVGYRSLIQKWALDAAGLLDPNPFNDFAADTHWLGKLAKQGELHRVAYPLCRKRYHGDNTHLKWFRKSGEYQRAAWERHCADLLNDFTEGMIYQTRPSPLNFHPQLFRPVALFDLTNLPRFASISTTQQDKKSCGQNSKFMAESGIDKKKKEELIEAAAIRYRNGCSRFGY